MTSAIEEQQVKATGTSQSPITISMPSVTPPQLPVVANPDQVLVASHPHAPHPHPHQFGHPQSPLISLQNAAPPGSVAAATAAVANTSAAGSAASATAIPLSQQQLPMFHPHPHSHPSQQQQQHDVSTASAPTPIMAIPNSDVPALSAAAATMTNRAFLPTHSPSIPSIESQVQPLSNTASASISVPVSTMPVTVPMPISSPTAAGRLPPRAPTPISTSSAPKRRRGGRRVANPQISAEERKRQRVLKNRESAMRSLAKKAEFSAMLERKQADTLEQTKNAEDNLQNLLSMAVNCRSMLQKVSKSSSNDHLTAKVDVLISKAHSFLSENDQQPQPQRNQQQKQRQQPKYSDSAPLQQQQQQEPDMRQPHHEVASVTTEDHSSTTDLASTQITSNPVQDPDNQQASNDEAT